MIEILFTSRSVECLRVDVVNITKMSVRYHGVISKDACDVRIAHARDRMWTYSALAQIVPSTSGHQVSDAERVRWIVEARIFFLCDDVPARAIDTRFVSEPAEHRWRIRQCLILEKLADELRQQGRIQMDVVVGLEDVLHLGTVIPAPAQRSEFLVGDHRIILWHIHLNDI